MGLNLVNIVVAVLFSKQQDFCKNNKILKNKHVSNTTKQRWTKTVFIAASS